VVVGILLNRRLEQHQRGRPAEPSARARRSLGQIAASAAATYEPQRSRADGAGVGFGVKLLAEAIK
jgi:hypothetical protein